MLQRATLIRWRSQASGLTFTMSYLEDLPRSTARASCVRDLSLLLSCSTLPVLCIPLAGAGCFCPGKDWPLRIWIGSCHNVVKFGAHILTTMHCWLCKQMRAKRK